MSDTNLSELKPRIIKKYANTETPTEDLVDILHYVRPCWSREDIIFQVSDISVECLFLATSHPCGILEGRNT